MVEHRARLEGGVAGYAKGFERCRRAVDAHGDVAQMHRLAGVDGQHQAWVVATLDLTVDLRLVVAQRLGGLARLLLGATAEAQQGLLVTITHAADVTFYVGLEFIVGRLDPYFQFTVCQRCATEGQQERATGNSS